MHSLTAEITHLNVARFLSLAGEIRHKRRITDIVDTFAEAFPRKRINNAVVRAIRINHRLIRRRIVIVRAEMVGVVAKSRIAAQIRAETIGAAIVRRIFSSDVMNGVPCRAIVVTDGIPHVRRFR